jgi:hypothetical protein
MRCSKMAMKRKSEMRMAVAANPKEMASTDVPKFLSVDSSPLASAAAAIGSDSDGIGVGYPGHGPDLCPNPLMAASRRPPLQTSLCTHCNFHLVKQNVAEKSVPVAEHS